MTPPNSAVAEAAVATPPVGTPTAYSQPYVKVVLGEGIATVTLDRAPANAVNLEVYDQLRRVFHAIADDAAVRVVIFTGSGRLFCGGNEVRDFIDIPFETANEYLAHARLAYNAQHDCPVPIVGAINGTAAGTGLILASLCDVRVVSQAASFMLPEINIGLAGGARHLLRLVGHGTARLMAYTGRKLGAEQALRVGLADFVEPPEQVMARAREVALEIARKSPVAIRTIKRGLNVYDSTSLKEGFEFECDLIAQTLRTPEAAEAAAAFLDKRAPRFAS